jgi:NAD(P) transhydrogenase
VTTAEGPRELAADAVLVVTGSHPHRPPGVPYDDADVHDADGILRIDHLPGSLTVLGGGVIGCEYACMFAAMGVEVHLVDQRLPFAPFLDPEMGERGRRR